jgi:hypothetical protein
VSGRWVVVVRFAAYMQRRAWGWRGDFSRDFRSLSPGLLRFCYRETGRRVVCVRVNCDAYIWLVSWVGGGDKGSYWVGPIDPWWYQVWVGVRRLSRCEVGLDCTERCTGKRPLRRRRCARAAVGDLVVAAHLARGPAST